MGVNTLTVGSPVCCSDYDFLKATIVSKQLQQSKQLVSLNRTLSSGFRGGSMTLHMVLKPNIVCAEQCAAVAPAWRIEFCTVKE